ncbi:hypothetical protein CORC01_10521 [Colletotrichum orchidophilum]|uniref:Uncharacterized protein n=1 Tax=Colletotrichum orchidophilum TaxID=1209926 RepID=A0A1G4AYM9_9PEZI|nr:uncharacterized protein CORC01_10521 [Colletotrichum orchidophilum]OHE94183.1 hypothetical protein CORC01_10521 [Colletotrichum orchidophilum]
MESCPFLSRFIVQERNVASSWFEEIAAESGGSLIGSEHGAWIDIQGKVYYVTCKCGATGSAGGNEQRAGFATDTERRDASETRAEEEEDQDMPDAPSASGSDYGGGADPDIGDPMDIDNEPTEIESVSNRTEQLSSAPHQPCSHEDVQVVETSEDVKMGNSDW